MPQRAALESLLAVVLGALASGSRA